MVTAFLVVLSICLWFSLGTALCAYGIYHGWRELSCTDKRCNGGRTHCSYYCPRSGWRFFTLTLPLIAGCVLGVRGLLRKMEWQAQTLLERKQKRDSEEARDLAAAEREVESYLKGVTWRT